MSKNPINQFAEKHATTDDAGARKAQVLDPVSPAALALAMIGDAWQKRLRLQDWKVTYAFARPYDMPSDTCQGKCNKVDCTKVAKITLMDPADWNPAEVSPYDVEETLIHELLHLLFPDHGDDYSAGDTLQFEQGLNMVAEALLSLSRDPASTE